jgi:hypothetical protein
MQKHRISTNIGKDQKVTVELKQDYDLLEILSLRFDQQQAYSSFCSDYGVVCGRVSVNNGLGIPNAKVSIFVPLTTEHENDLVISTLYPFKSVLDTNIDGYRYNLLPSRKQHGGHEPTGTFPDQRDVLTREEVLSEAKRQGVEVAECHFEEKSVKRGRPRKEKEVVGEKKKRGRPRKEKEMVSNKAGEDLIASLLNESKREDPIAIPMSVCEKPTKATPMSGCEKATDPKATPMSGCEKATAKEPSADEEEEETVVIKYEIDGITYLKSEDNVLYDMKTHDCVGIWNELTKKIDEIPDEDEDE